MKTVTVRELRSQTSEILKGPENVARHQPQPAHGLIVPLKDPKNVPLEMRRQLYLTLSAQLAEQLQAKGITEDEASVASKTLRSVVADANVLLSAALGHAARKVFEKARVFHVITTDVAAGEVRKYLPSSPPRLPWTVRRSSGSSTRCRSRSCRRAATGRE